MTTLKVINERTAQRRGIASLWASVNPILYDGEIGYEKDTGKLKFGDGLTHWNDLAYFVTGGGGSAALPWDVDTSYSTGAFVVGSDDFVYASLVDGNVGHDPTTDNAVHWTATPSGGGGGGGGTPYSADDYDIWFVSVGSGDLPSGSGGAFTGWASFISNHVTVADNGDITFDKAGLYLLTMSAGFNSPTATTDVVPIQTAINYIAPIDGSIGNSLVAQVLSYPDAGVPQTGQSGMTGVVLVANDGDTFSCTSFTDTDVADGSVTFGVASLYLGATRDGGGGGGGGASYDLQGAWDVDTTYTTGQQVESPVSGSPTFDLYTSLVDGNIGNDPATDGGVHWELVPATIPAGAVVTLAFGVPANLDIALWSLYSLIGTAGIGTFEKIVRDVLDNVGGAATTVPDVTDSQITTIVLDTPDCAVTMPTLAPGKSLIVVIKQDFTGGRTVTWDANIQWPGGVTPVLSTAPEAADVFRFVCPYLAAGWHGSILGQGYAQ